MGNVLVIGSSNTDMVCRTLHIPKPGETLLGSDFQMFPGGKGANQAIAAARAGADVHFVARLGSDDFGRNALENYRKEGIRTAGLKFDPHAPSGVAVIMVEETTGENSIVVASGANAKLAPADLQEAGQLFQQASVLLVQLEIPLDTVAYALQRAREAGIVTILNPAPAQVLDEEILAATDYITPNIAEAETLTSLRVEQSSQVKEAAGKLLAHVKQGVLITQGARGIYYKTQNGEEAHIPAERVQAIDSTAAGDVFNGYFAAGLAAGKSTGQAVKAAGKAAARSVTRAGAQPSIPYYTELIS